MKIQSLSVVVPNKRCVNDCGFCVSKMHAEDYPNMMDDNKPFYDLYLKDYLKRLEFARDNGCNTVMLTGNSEPQQNRNFLTYFGLFMMLLERPFRNIEMQTTGVLLDEPYLRFLRNHVGVNTISLSLSAMDSAVNQAYNGTPNTRALAVDVPALCAAIKKYDFNLRLSLNLTDWFDTEDAEFIFGRARELRADQVTLRVLYRTECGDTLQDEWIGEHGAALKTIEYLTAHVEYHGEDMGALEYGAHKYSLNGMSVVVDDDCMAQSGREELKYLILRPDCKLYSRWDDPASLLF